MHVQESGFAYMAQAVKQCHFHGLLYCPDCHRGDTAEVPACVLHEWDFTRYPICDFAIEFLASIYEQPLLCISAVNPGDGSPLSLHLPSYFRQWGDITN